MINRNYIKTYKIVLVRWVDKALNQSFPKKKSSQGSKVQGFGHVGP